MEPLVTAARLLGDNDVEVGIMKTMHTLPAVLLHDNCCCSECLHPTTLQRVIDVQLAGPEGGKAKSATVDKDQLCVEWADGHKSKFAGQWLLDRTVPVPAFAPTIREGWKSAWMQENMVSQCTFDFSEVLARGETTEGWLRALQRYGFTKLTGAPQNPGEISRLSQSLALPLRRTVFFFSSSFIYQRRRHLSSFPFGVHQ
jgi:gamma-butyrobetaine dioxygenase